MFVLDDNIRAIVSDGTDSLYNALKKRCRLIYPSIQVACTNCIIDPIGRKSTNRWKSGGPVQFPRGGVCPMCYGAGTISTENTEIISLVIEEDPTKFANLKIMVTLPKGAIQTKGFIRDLPKILKTDTLIKDIDAQPYIEYRYKLSGEPIISDKMVQRQYFHAIWERMG